MTDERVILITGARKGIGRFLAQHYAAAGWRVVGCSRGPFAGTLDRYEHVRLDVTDEQSALALFADIRARHGRLDALINNAGVASMNHALLTPMETVRRILAVNVEGTFLFCREAARLMKDRGGRIINLTSVAVPLSLEGEAAYAASKAAVESLTRVLARELGPWNVTVNALGPTALPTDLLTGVSAAQRKALLARQAIRRPADFADVAAVTDFFLSERSGMVTGQVLYLGGVC